MEKIINYEKDIKFNTKIGLINSISIEDKYEIENNTLKASFIVNGDYKLNELSINNETFSYELPIEYEFDNIIEKDLFNAQIENFEYRVEDDVLKVFIDYKINYTEKERMPLIPGEEELNEGVEFLVGEEPVSEKVTEEIEKETEEVVETKVEEINLEEDEECTTLKIHIYKLGETISSIATLYNTDEELIKEYNDITSLENKDKLIIPLIDE